MSTKLFLFILVFAVLLAGCGQKSTIKNDVEAEKLSCAYGDCEHIIYDLSFALDDPAFAYNTPLAGLGPIAGGLIQFVGDIFAKTTKIGDVEFSYIQPIPSLPERLRSVRMKRFFLFMKPHKVSQQDSNPGFIRRTIERYILGQGEANFDFIRMFGMRLSATTIEEPESYSPIFVQGKISKTSELLRMLKQFSPDDVIDSASVKEAILSKYNIDTKKEDTLTKEYGKIHYLETKGEAFKLKSFFLRKDEFKGYYKRIILLNNAIFIELNKDPLADEVYRHIMEQYDEELKELGLTYAGTCNEKTCLELKVPNVNLVPFSKRGNALKLDALLKPDFVPDAFELKGFVEFEVKIESAM